MTAGAPQWPEMIAHVAQSETRILGAIKEVKDIVSDHATRINTLEDSAERMKSAKSTAFFFLGIPGHVIGTLASAVGLVLGLAGVWALMGKF